MVESWQVRAVSSPARTNGSVLHMTLAALMILGRMAAGNWISEGCKDSNTRSMIALFGEIDCSRDVLPNHESAIWLHVLSVGNQSQKLP